ncbi:MAG TPA: SDR family oxidoreductase [Candidatus Saccharimonadales bacterium]|nr:SDR family oxidoreductase [Candidatus Saccharimonadales bacterium]
MNILITGASRGIGLATAKQLDSADNKLFLVASSKDSFTDSFRNATLFGTDLTKPAEISKLADEIVAQTDTIDVLINNVGVMVMKKFEAMTGEDINLLLDLNLRSHMLLTHALLPLLRRSNKPQIVFMSSMAAKSSIVGESIYGATKSGITNFANVLRNELGPDIRVSVVHAWGVDTWGAPDPETFIQPADVAATMEFIITRPATMMVESIDLSNPTQWRGGMAPWSPA